MGLFDYRMEGTQPQGMLQDLLKRYKAGVTERVGLLKQDPVGYLSQAAMEGLPPMPDIGQNPDGTIRRNPDDPATKWLADNVGFGALTVYHGSPHKFGKFDMSKIGSGEGAQAYGHGLYVSEAQDVAKNYQPRSYGYEERLLKEYSKAERLMDTDAMEALEAAMMHQTPKEIAESMGARAKSTQKSIASLYDKFTDGSLIKADIPDDQIGKMLDWDAPLSSQSEDVQRALMNLDNSHKFNEAMTGAEFYQSSLLSPGAVRDQADATARLKKLGIPGIKYFDQGSRDAGNGTRNFVLFDDQLPRILERNGVPTGAQPWQLGEYELLRHAPK